MTRLSPDRPPPEPSPRRRTIISPGFLAATLVVTGGCLAAQLWDAPTSPLVWLLVALSLLPLYSSIYNAVLFAKSALLHRSAGQELPTDLPAGELPPVAFVLASYQEPFDVAKMTFDCARDMEYRGRRTIVVVDNSADTSSEDFRRWKRYVESQDGRRPGLRVVFAYNEKKGGLKPGNLDLAQTLLGDAAYVVLLDIDSSLPLRGRLLERAVRQFQDDARLGMLQFHTTATNDHFNPLSGAVAVAQNALRLKHLLRADGGFAMFYGHNAMWRRSLLDQFGPWLEHHRGNVMVTEDLLKTVSAYTKGYTCRYADVTSGEWIPSSLDALESMWLRWSYGAMQVLSKYWRSIVSTPNLRPLERLDLLAFVFGYAATAVYFPLSLLWILFLSPGQVTFLTLLMLYLPIVASAIVVHRRYASQLDAPLGRKLWSLYAGHFLIEPFIFVVSLKALFNFAIGVGQGWKVTAKSVEETPSWPQVVSRHRVIVGFATALLVLLVASWGLRFDFAPSAFVSYLPTALMAVNLLLCVALYGRQGRNAGNAIEGTTVDAYLARTAAVVAPAAAVTPLALFARRRREPAAAVDQSLLPLNERGSMSRRSSQRRSWVR